MKDKILNLLAYLVLPLIIILLIANICISIFYYGKQFNFSDITNGKEESIIVAKTTDSDGNLVPLEPGITTLEKAIYQRSRDKFTSQAHYFIYDENDKVLFELEVGEGKTIKIIQGDESTVYEYN